MRMQSLCVVEGLDVLAGGTLGVVDVVPVRFELELEGERREEALGDHVVPGISLLVDARLVDPVAQTRGSQVELACNDGDGLLELRTRRTASGLNSGVNRRRLRLVT